MELHDGVPVEANARKSSATAKLEETSKLICLYKEALNNFKDKPKLVSKNGGCQLILILDYR